MHGLLKDTYVDDHVVCEVLIACDKSVAVCVFKADAFGDSWARVESIEVLHGCHDRVCCVVREDLNAQWQARHSLGRLGEQKFKGDDLGDRDSGLCPRRDTSAIVILLWDSRPPGWEKRMVHYGGMESSMFDRKDVVMQVAFCPRMIEYTTGRRCQPWKRSARRVGIDEARWSGDRVVGKVVEAFARQLVAGSDKDCSNGITVGIDVISSDIETGNGPLRCMEEAPWPKWPSPPMGPPGSATGHGNDNTLWQPGLFRHLRTSGEH
jgi:hypothetical protein